MFQSILFFVWFFTFNVTTSDEKYELIEDGHKYKTIELGKTTFEEIKNVMGRTDYQFVKHKKVYMNTGKSEYSQEDVWRDVNFYAWAHRYKKLGIDFNSKYVSFSGLNLDKTTINSITFRAPFKGITKKGIILNKSELMEVVKAYGKDLKNISFPPHSIQYHKEGIIFHFDAKTLNHRSLGGMYLDHEYLKVTAITITQPKQ